MSSVTEVRLGGAAFATIVGLGVPLLLLWPALFEGISFRSLPSWAIPAAAALVVYGVWLFVVALFAAPRDIEFVIGIFRAQEAVVLVFPVALVIGTRSVWRRLRSKQA